MTRRQLDPVKPEPGPEILEYGLNALPLLLACGLRNEVGKAFNRVTTSF